MGVRQSVYGHGHGHAAKAAHAVHAGRQLPTLELHGKLRRDVELLPLPGGLTTTLLQHCLPGVAADKWLGPLNGVCQKYGIDKTLRRLAAFLGQVGYESGNFARL
jgi:hypothetical protein